jgi:hypothetical protein
MSNFSNNRWWLLAAVIILSSLLFWAGPVLAQDDDLPAITLMETVDGTIDDDNPEARWTFDAAEGDRISVLVRAESGDLDPYLQIIDPTGRLLVESDDIAYPDQLDAALEAVELPRDGQYTIRVSRFDFEAGDTSGDFTLLILPAYARPLRWDAFDGEHEWSAGRDELVTTEIAAGSLIMAVEASNALVWTAPTDLGLIPRQAYVQVEAAVTNRPDYWEYGLIFRQTSDTDYYVFSVSSRGDWAFLARSGASTWLHLQDWTEHPALADLAGGAVLGVLMDGDDFTFFVDGTALGTFEATNHPTPGTIALGAGTIDQQDVLPAIRYDNLLITEPLPSGAVAAGEQLDPLESWGERDSAPVLAELVERELVPPEGSQVMLVPDSFTTVSRPGIQVLSLGQGRTQIDFVMSAVISMESESAENACGLVFRRPDEDQYSIAFLDGLGGLGLSTWQTDRYTNAFYTDAADGDGSLSGDKLLLVAQGDTVYVYLNGQPVATRANTALDGGVGIASLSYDGQFVNCQFDNTWLWTWE